ncbi:hypothetical protein CISIN_1g035033mg [Citrus sinensis]|uniref:Uncharacterized protein n=1 Tax=Citrus sinensis TaxID=2711 RepID=A0A067GUG1_CITSI|nr:hypothetical protein CISIN_1g035033mg [Citrus sinensis]
MLFNILAHLTFFASFHHGPLTSNLQDQLTYYYGHDAKSISTFTMISIHLTVLLIAIYSFSGENYSFLFESTNFVI